MGRSPLPASFRVKIKSGVDSTIQILFEASDVTQYIAEPCFQIQQRECSYANFRYSCSLIDNFCFLIEFCNVIGEMYGAVAVGTINTSAMISLSICVVCSS